MHLPQHFQSSVVLSMIEEQLRQCMERQLRGMRWKYRSGFLESPTACAPVVAKTVYRDGGEYTGPRSTEFRWAGNVDEWQEWSDMTADDPSWPTGEVQRRMTASEAVSRFFRLCRAVHDRSKLSELPVSGNDSKVFARAFAEDTVSRPDVEALATMPRVMAAVAKDFGGEGDKWQEHTTDRMLVMVRDAICLTFTGNGARSLGLVDPCLTEVRDKIFDILTTDAMPTRIPKCLFGTFVLRMANAAKGDRFRKVGEAMKLGEHCYRLQPRRGCYLRKEETPVGLAEAVEWAEDLVGTDDQKESMTMFSREIFWEDAMECQATSLVYYAFDFCRRNVVYLTFVARRVPKMAAAKELLVKVTTGFTQILSSVVRDMAGGRVLKTCGNLYRAAVSGRTRALSRALEALRGKGSLEVRKATELHYFHTRRLEMQISAMATMVVCSIKTCMRNSLLRMKHALERDQGKTDIPVESLTTARHSILMSTVQRLRASLAVSVLPENEPQRFKAVTSKLDEVSSFLIGTVYAGDSDDLDLQTCMGDDPEPSACEEVLTSRREQYVSSMGIPVGAARKGVFAVPTKPPSEGCIAAYAALDGPTLTAQEASEVLDLRTMPALPSATWSSDRESTIVPLRNIMAAEPKTFREDPEAGKIVPDVEEADDFRQWVMWLGGPLGNFRKTTPVACIREITQLSSQLPEANVRVMAALEQWIPPVWTLKTESESVTELRQLIGARRLTASNCFGVLSQYEQIPRWSLSIVFQDPFLAVQKMEGGISAVRSPLGGVTVRLPSECILFREERLAEVSDRREGGEFGYRVQEALKYLDRMRNLTRRDPRRLGRETTRCKDVVAKLLKSVSVVNEGNLEGWHILLTNMNRMWDEEKRGSRTSLAKVLKQQLRLVEDKFKACMQARDENLKKRTEQRASVVRRLPLQMQTRLVSRKRDELRAKKGLSDAEKVFLAHMDLVGDAKVLSDDTVWAYSSLVEVSK